MGLAKGGIWERWVVVTCPSPFWILWVEHFAPLVALELFHVQQMWPGCLQPTLPGRCAHRPRHIVTALGPVGYKLYCSSFRCCNGPLGRAPAFGFISPQRYWVWAHLLTSSFLGLSVTKSIPWRVTAGKGDGLWRQPRNRTKITGPKRH